MNKATLISTINGFLTAIITQLKVRNSLLELVNTLFQTTHTMYVADAVNTLSYKINFKKVGNIVYVDGYLKNGYSSMITPTIGLVTIDDSLYFVKTDTSVNIPIMNNSTFSIGGLIFNEDFISLQSNLGAGSLVSFNGHYQTND